ncbi:CHAD domain-containing protein [Arthrobacter sp. AET 35A]|uniref:CYTH and CHAD domain-containing protein n=1 Tax=Arthrobacter sp. AET 35A TaxID=2292643 RepID=UPI001783BB1C|nr:CYTH and CHAD domain-containing protein [Arthrobacter sp. AET 35A]MBE0011433.1 CHAD domain-containing protein [Arthrobacter sp. AET 35A]
MLVPLPGADEAPPAEVIDLVRVHVRDQNLTPVARLTTTRTITNLIDPTGNVLIELSDDVVHAQDLTTGVERSWREWEAEAVGVERLSTKKQTALLDAVEHLVLNANASPASGEPKLARAMGGVPEMAPLDGKPGSVRHVLTASFREVTAELKTCDLRVRRHQEGALHQLRVRTRTLRSMLKTYGHLLDKDQASDLEGRLQSLGRNLGAARDAEVMQDLIREGIARQPQGTIARHAIRRLEGTAAADYEKAFARVLRELNSAEYFRMLDALDDFASRLPLAEGKSNGGKARSRLPRAVEDQQTRVVKSARRANREADLDAQLELLHDVRKRSKRLRYAIRAVAGASGFSFGRTLGKSMKASEKIQNTLGIHRDSVLFQQYVLKSGRAAHRARENSFSYGVLFEAESSIQRAAEARFRKMIKQLNSK